tara:strand:- start:339 stop:824 length:486 start_codon:yes stop_codon:yes gene_type:complete
MIKSDKKNLIFNFLTVIIIFFLDRLSKIYILKLAEFENTLDIYLLPNLNFYLVWNKGISFGLLPFSNSFGYLALTFLISLLILIILIMLIKEENNFKKYSLLLILGGALGNLYDRVKYSAVPDFIDLHIGNIHWFIFNVADIFISIGVICLIYAEIFFKKE